MLTGLVTALGAAARFANRSANMGGLVKNGCNRAIIRVTLYNEGEDAFQPELYGPSIIIERILNKEGGGAYAIKDHTGRKVSGTRKDVEAIMEQFNIQVDNPCTILMQDASKLFLNSNKPEKKYELFLKATQLEQMKIDLEEIGVNLKTSEETLATKQASLKTMEDRIKSLEAKVQALNALQKYRSKVKDLRGKLAWAHVQAQESDLEAIEAELAQVEEKTAKLQEAKVGREASLAHMQGDQQAKAAALEELRTDATDITTTTHRLSEEERGVRNEASRVDAEVDARKQEQTRIQARRSNVQNQVRKLQMAGQGEKKEAEYRRRLDQAAKKRGTVEKMTEDVKAAESNEPTFSREVDTDEDLIGNVAMELETLNRDIQKLSAEEKRLRSATKDRNAVFGVSAPAILKLIQTHKNKFEQCPIGPIGMYVTLVDDEWAQPVEGFLGKSFEKFIVHSVEDMKLLQQLIRQARIFPEPQLIITPISQPRYVIGDHQLPDPKFKTLLSAVRIDNDACFNALIDEATPESILLFHRKDDAKAVMFERSDRTPKNVKDAFSLEQSLHFRVQFGTQSFYSMKTAAPRLQADMTEALNKAVEILKERQQRLAPIQREHSTINQRLNRSRAQLKSARELLRTAPAEIERLNAEIEDLEKAPEVEPSKVDEINALQATLPDFDAKIDAEQAEIEVLQGKKRDILKKLEPISAKQKANNLRKDELERQLQEAAKDLDTLRNGVAALTSTLPKFEVALLKLQEQSATATAKHSDQSQLVEEWVIKASNLAPRPDEPVTDSPEKISRTIDKIEETIAAQEQKEDLSAAVLEEYENSKQTLDALQSAITETSDTIDLAAHMLTVRAHKWIQFRRHISQRANALFISYLSYRNFDGQLVFDHKERTLNIHINPNRADTTGSRDTTTLSGGERSYSTVSLLLALWDTMESPFRAMDEFDVFMDTANRKISMELLIDAATQKSSRQHIFLTPQQLQSVHVSDKIKVFKMHPPVRNNRTITEMIGGPQEE